LFFFFFFFPNLEGQQMTHVLPKTLLDLVLSTDRTLII